MKSFPSSLRLAPRASLVVVLASLAGPIAPARSLAEESNHHAAPAPAVPASHEPAAVQPASQSATQPAAGQGHASAAHSPATTEKGTERLDDREILGLLTLGQSLTDRGDFAAGEIAYRQVLASDAALDQIKTALLGLAHMHRKQGYLTKAAAIYEKYLKEYPDDDRVPDALLDLGRTLRDMGAPKLAIARFYAVINSTLKLSSSAGFEHYQLLAKTAQFEVAETYFQVGDFAEATKFYSRLRLLDLAPADRARAHFKSAYSLQLAGELEGAVTSLRAFLEQWPNDDNVPEARYLLATSLRSLRRSQEALNVTLELLADEKARTSTEPKRWIYWQRRTGNQLANEFFQSGDILNALRIYQSLAALSDDPAWRAPVTYQVALCYERLNDTEQAVKVYRAIVDEAGPKPSPEIGELVRMANARISHLEWRDTTDRQVSVLFDTTTGQAKPPPPPKPSNPNDADRSPATTPPAL